MYSFIGAVQIPLPRSSFSYPPLLLLPKLVTTINNNRPGPALNAPRESKAHEWVTDLGRLARRQPTTTSERWRGDVVLLFFFSSPPPPSYRDLANQRTNTDQMFHSNWICSAADTRHHPTGWFCRRCRRCLLV